MAGVRLVATVYAIFGVIALVVAGLALIGVLNAMSTDAGWAVVLPLMVYVALLSLGPFTVWAILTGLCELHEQGSRVERLLAAQAVGSLEASTSAAAEALSVEAAAVPTDDDEPWWKHIV